MSAHQNHKKEILKFYTATNDLVDQHRNTYSKLLKKLNENKSLPNLMNTNLDDFMVHSFPDFKDFKTKIESQDINDSDIQFIFDLNKQEFIPSLQLPNKKKVIDLNFELHLEGNGNNTSNKIIKFSNGSPLTYNGNIWNSMLENNNQNSFVKNNNYSDVPYFSWNSTDQARKSCNCNQCCSCKPSLYIMTTLSSVKINIIVDNYFNIYIPILKTYLVSNYVQYPFYAFYINNDKLNLYHNIIKEDKRIIRYNKKCPNDLKEFNEINSFVNSSNNYSTSQDKRNEFKNTYFKYILDFYKYYQKQTYFEQFQILAEDLNKLNPSVVSNLSENDDNVDEEKIFMQSQRIRELEIQNAQYQKELLFLRKERQERIEEVNNKEIEIDNRNKLIEQVNNRLKEQIDFNANQAREIIVLNTKLLDIPELMRKSHKLDQNKKELEMQILDLNLKCEKLEKTNNSFCDKQIQCQQKLDQVRKEKLNILEENKDLNLNISQNESLISELKYKLSNAKHETKEVEDKLSSIINNIIDVDSKEKEKDTYQDILLNQLNDKNQELENMKQKYNEQVALSKEKLEEYNKLKSRVMQLIN